MKLRKSRAGALAAGMLALVLSACGGGSGDSGGAGAVNNSPGNWLTFDPGAPSATQFEGESTSVILTARASRTFSVPFNVAIIDPAGVISPQVDISAQSPLEYRAALQTSRTLRAGDHSTMLEVRLCEDTPMTCAKPLPGSPWRVPLKVQVKPVAQAQARVTLVTPSVSVTTYPGESTEFTVETRLSTDLMTRNVRIAMFDPSSITNAASSQWTQQANGNYLFKLSTATSNALAAGAYTSNLELRVCEDDARVCRQPVAGSPWIVPLSLKILSPNNLTALAPVEGVGAWSTYQGNAAHTGFVAANFDPARFSRRFKVEALGNYAGNYKSAAIDNGRAFFVRRTAGNRAELVAVSEDTGELVWKVDMGTLNQVNPPAAANGRVYLTSTGHGDSFLWVYDQASGQQLRKETLSSQWPSYSAPTLFGTDVYTINGYYGGISRYGDAEGAFKWHGLGVAYEGWSPSTDGRFVYAYSTPDNILNVLDAADGSLAYSIGERYPYSTYFISRPVVLTDTQQALVGDGNLAAFDLKTRTRSWLVDGASIGTPAYGNGNVYAIGTNGKSFAARSPETGALLWEVTLDDGYYTDIIVTRNLAFVGSDTATQAIDLATRKVVWTYPLGGSMAMSARGVLYILTSTGALAAINLR